MLISEATVEQKRKTSTSVGQRFRCAGISASKQARRQRVEAGGSRHLTFSRAGHISASSAGRPYIRLSGAWLQRLGFRRGARIEITEERGRLLLTVVREA